MTSSTSRQTTAWSEGIATILLFVFSGSFAFFGTFHGTQLASGQLRSPIIGGIFWPMSVIGAVLVTLSATAVILAVVVGALESISTPQIRGRTEYTLIGSGGVVGTIGFVLTVLLSWTMSTRPIVTPIPESTTTGLVALVLVAGSLSGAFYRFWRPKDASAPVTSRTPQADPPAPEVVTERRIKRSGDADSDAPPTPTPPGQFTISDRDNRTSLSTNDDRKPGQVDFSELQYNWTTETDVSLEDIGGMDELKQTLQTDVIKPLTTGKEKANALGIPLPNIVFYGSPGTGKTFMAKALATELGLPFALLSGADVQSKWINESAQKINTLFEEAKTVAESRGGAVVFLDELDAVLKQRSGAGQAHEEDNKVVAEFLNHLQDTSEHDVLFIGATNRLDALDDAGIRSGRIDKKIRVGKPDLEAREAILHAQLADRPNNLTDNQVERIANRTEGLVAADLKSIVVDAARASAFARGSEVIEWEDLVETVEQYG